MKVYNPLINFFLLWRSLKEIKRHQKGHYLLYIQGVPTFKLLSSIQRTGSPFFFLPLHSFFIKKDQVYFLKKKKKTSVIKGFLSGVSIPEKIERFFSLILFLKKKTKIDSF